MLAALSFLDLGVSMSLRRSFVALTTTMLLLSSACRDVPSSTDSMSSGPERTAERTVSRVVSPANCDATWASAASGNWTDSTRWTPVGVPALFDQVCFTAPGSYVVTIPVSVSASDLWVGDGVAVRLSATAIWSLALGNVEVAPLGSLTFHDCVTVAGGSLTVNGAFAAIPGASCIAPPLHRFAAINSNGTLQLASATIIGTGTGGVEFSHRGTLQLSGTSRLDVGAHDVDIDGWTVTGAGVLQLDFTSASATNGELRWVNGTLPPRDAATGAATVRVRHGRLVLDDPSLAGAIDAMASSNPLPTRIRGDVGAAMDVGIIADLASGVVELEGGSAGSDVSILGRVTFARGSVTSTRVTLYAGRVLNSGTIAVTNTNGTLALNGLENRGRLDVLGGVGTLLSRGPSPAILTAQNHGTIHVRGGSSLWIAGTNLEQYPTASTQGLIALYGSAHITGTGVLDEVWLTQNSWIAPGTIAAPIGALTFGTLRVEPQPTSNAELRVDVADTSAGSFDVVRVTTRVTLGGTLAVTTLHGTLGTCGQRVPVLSIAKGASVTGTFDQHRDLSLAPDRRWRVVAEATAHSLVGFDPRTALSLTPGAVAVVEGGAAATTSACLGGPAPSATVTVSPVARGGQVSLAPTPLTFTTSNWALPQAVTLQALDDARAEGPHVDSVRFTLASADPRYVGLAQRQQQVDVSDNDPAVDLALALVASDDAAEVGEQLDARFRVSNGGPGASTGSTFTLTPMAGVEYVAGGGAVACTTAAGALTCTIGALAAGASVEFTLLFRAVTVGTHGQTARIKGRDFDANPGDNALTWVATIS